MSKRIRTFSKKNFIEKYHLWSIFLVNDFFDYFNWLILIVKQCTFLNINSYRTGWSLCPVLHKALRDFFDRYWWVGQKWIQTKPKLSWAETARHSTETVTGLRYRLTACMLKAANTDWAHLWCIRPYEKWSTNINSQFRIFFLDF